MPETFAAEAAISVLKSDMTGYSSITEQNKQVSYTNQTTVYALLPVWFLNYTYKGKDYPFVMNGQTGTRFGILPVSGLKKFLLTAGILAVLVFLILLIGGSLF